MTIASEKTIGKSTTPFASRRTIRAYRAGTFVLIVAEGDLPTPGFDVDIEQDPIRIFPPHFDLLAIPRSGIWPQVVTPYRYAEFVRYPQDISTITVHHADGQDEIEIQDVSSGLHQFAALPSVAADDSDEAIGTSPNLKFDEAFRAALANLPYRKPEHPDEQTRVEVIETAGLFGGIAGLHELYVRVRRTVI
ncbi:hypothetical protein [Mycobacterium sp. 48b]|uniref:hypothetical protein n=1 Tax=Mycobacterium sp. 48b TaxID=3400426 RepID=UPI003AABAE2C